MNRTSLVYISGKCFALKIEKSYPEPALYYTADDELVNPAEQSVLDLSGIFYEYRYEEHKWFRDRYAARDEHEYALQLADSVCLIKDINTRESLVFKVTDPNYGKILEAAKNSKSTTGYASGTRKTSAAKRQPASRMQDQMELEGLDAFNQKSFEITITITKGRYGGAVVNKSCCCKSENCRHTMAVVEFLYAEMCKLKEAYIHSEIPEDKSLFISGQVENMISDCIRDDSDEDNQCILDVSEINKLKEIAGEVSAVHSESYFNGVLKYLFSRESGWADYESRLLEDYKYVIGAFYMDPVLKKYLDEPEEFENFLPTYYGRQEKSNVVTFKRELKHIQMAEKELNKGKGPDSPYKQFIVKYSYDGADFIRYFADNVENFCEEDLTFLELYLAAYEQMPRQIQKTIIDKVDRTNITKPIDLKYRDALIGQLLKPFTPDEQAIILSGLQNYHLDFNTYCGLSRELQEQLADSMQASTEFLTYILNTVAKDYDDGKKADLILKMARKVSSWGDQRSEAKLLTEAAGRLKNNALLKFYLKSRFDLLEHTVGKKSIRITEEDVTEYFHPDFLVTEERDELRTNYYLFAAGDTIPDTEKDKSTEKTEELYENKCLFYFSEIKEGLCRNSYMCTYLSDDSLKLIEKLAMSGRKDESERKKQEMLEAINARNFEKEHKYFAMQYKELCRGFQEDKIILTDTFKANISYMFDFSEDEVRLGFKVGNTRDYIVKNANDFLKAFRNGETITYGKDLVLTHDINNLKDEDRPIMRTLSPLVFKVMGNGQTAKRYLLLSGPIFANVIELLKDRTVLVGEQPTLVRLTPVDIKLKINEKYELKADYKPNNQIIIFSGTKGYIYTRNTNGISTIDSIQADSDQIRLLEFVKDNGNVSIYPILNDFKKNIYSRFYDSFQVADKIKENFKLSVIRINAYFDYIDKAITLKTEYFKDERPIKRSDLTEKMDIVKAECFDADIGRLGFEDGIIRDEGKILSFLKMDFSNLKRQASVYLSESLNNKKLVSLNRQVIRISNPKSGIIDAVLERSDYTEEELAEILQAMKRKKKFILLSGDRIIDLDSKEAKEFRDTVKDLGLEAGKLYKKKRISMVEALKAFAHENSCSIDRHLRTMVDEIRAFKDCEVEIPKLSYEMREYQKEGYRWLSVLSKYNMGGVLADDMGLGKTLQIIALIKADKTKKPSLIVCPKSLVFNWINEFARFDGETSVTEIYGLSEKREEIIKEIEYNKKTVYVTSYDSLRNDIDFYDGVFNYCVLDEAQYIKNVTALKSKSVKEIKADHRFALTGTPIENNIIDLWSIFDFIMPGYFEELSEFKSSAGQEEFHEQVAKRIGPFVLRRIKENVLADLPAKYETILSCDMTSMQRKSYDALRKKARDTIAQNGKAFDLLPMLMKMRQTCVDPAMCIDDYSGGSGKMQMLEELIPGYLAEGHRILLFSQFVKGLNQVEKILQEHGIGYYMLTGETPAKERGRMIDEFNSTTGTDVFLISLKAGGTGLNLTGADTVIHLDPWWNVAAEDQATDRAHRIGQTKNVEVIKLVSENSIEQRVIELQNIKKDIIDRVISNDESSVTGASLEDIAYILN